MSYQPFLIAGFQTGLQTDLKPWLLPQDAFQSIINGHVHNAVLQKRDGMEVFQWMVNASTETVNAISNASPGSVTLSGAAGLANGDFFQIRDATGMTEVNKKTFQIQNLVGATFDLTSIYGEPIDTTAYGVYTGAGLFFKVPKLPIMGIKNFVDTNGESQILIFDTKRAAIYNDATRVFDPLDTVDIFNGNESSFVSAAAFGKTKAFLTSAFFFTNFNGDTTLPITPIYQYTTGSTTTAFIPETTPTIGTRNYVISAQFIFSIRSRLILLNTVEGQNFPVGVPLTGSGTNFSQRMRWCRSFNPATGGAAPIIGNPWDELTPGNGGFVDAATSEVIIGATQLEDTIIVQFTNSVWIIEPTSDPALPFRWVKVNSYRTSSAPYANLAHDGFIISYGNRGIVASSRNEVKRIDQKVEDFMMNEVNTDFVERMYSGRDYTHKRSWTLFPSANNRLDPNTDSTTSNLALVRTDEEGAWAYYDVALKDLDPVNGTNMSCLGYGSFSIDLTFDDLDAEDDFDSATADKSFNEFLLQAETEIFLGGDQIGRILTLNSGGADIGVDIDFELMSAGWNPFAEQGMQAQMGYVDIYVDADMNTNFEIEFYVDDITSPYAVQSMNCLPNLGFLADIVDITQSNPAVFNAPSHGLATGTEVYIYGVNGMKTIDGGPYTVTFIDQNFFSIATIDSTLFPAYTGGGQVVERAFENERCWIRTYAGGKGYQHYIKITNSGSNDVLNINAFKPQFRPIGNRIIGG